jgi:hypothetical protein
VPLPFIFIPSFILDQLQILKPYPKPRLVYLATTLRSRSNLQPDDGLGAAMAAPSPTPAPAPGAASRSRRGPPAAAWPPRPRPPRPAAPSSLLRRRRRCRRRGEGAGGGEEGVPVRRDRTEVAAALGGPPHVPHPGHRRGARHIQAQVLHPRHVPLPKVRCPIHLFCKQALGWFSCLSCDGFLHYHGVEACTCAMLTLNSCRIRMKSSIWFI